MKIKVFSLFLFSAILLTSCIQDEPLDREVDITAFSFEGVEDDTYINQESKRITLEAENIDVTNMTPVIEVSRGATISPKPGVPYDFTDPVLFTITSEDGSWTKTYQVIVKLIIPEPPVELDTIRYDFDDWHIIGAGKYQYPAINDDLWSSANSGIALAKGSQVVEYPTRFTEDAHDGKYAALLETQKGGTYWGNLIPIFSGSLFRGRFDINLGNFVKSAKFGQPHTKDKGKPIEFNGFYKYQYGSPFYDENDQIIPGKIDECSIYAVLYKVTKGEAGINEYLDGTNVMSSDKVIARAQLPDGSNKSSFTEFKLPFIYTEEPDYDKYDYKLAIVFASSKEGDYYRGAIGSTLIVDKVEVISQQYETEEDQ